MRFISTCLLAASATLFSQTSVDAVVLTFDDSIPNTTTYSFDADGDNRPDAVFTALDFQGFGSSAPPTMNFVDPPGLQGWTATVGGDLRVDFVNGAVNVLSFGYAYSTQINGYETQMFVFDGADNLIATGTGTGLMYDANTAPNGIESMFPEGEVSVSFAGTAAYVLIDFATDAEAYLLDNFSGTFGSTEDLTPTVPEPATTAALGAVASLLTAVAIRRRKSRSSLSA